MVVVMGLVLKITLKQQFTIEIKGMITLFTSAIRLTHGLIETYSSNKVNQHSAFTFLRPKKINNNYQIVKVYICFLFKLITL